MRFKARVQRWLTGEVMIEIAHSHPSLQQSHDSRCVCAERQVEDGHGIAGRGADAFHEFDVAFGARDQAGGRGFVKKQLLQGAQPVAIAVEDEVLRPSRI